MLYIKLQPQLSVQIGSNLFAQFTSQLLGPPNNQLWNQLHHHLGNKLGGQIYHIPYNQLRARLNETSE